MDVGRLKAIPLFQSFSEDDLREDRAVRRGALRG